MIREYLAIVLKSLASRKLRAWLTIIGIIIGIAAIISLITISQALQKSIKEVFEEIGSDKITILPKSVGPPGSSFEGLTNDDVSTVENVNEVEWAIPALIKNARLEFSREVKVQRIAGLPSDQAGLYFESFGIELAAGQPFTTDSRKAVIGSKVAADLFEKPVKLRDRILIEGGQFQVIGILESMGNPDDDNFIWIPMATARELFNDEENIGYMVAKVRAGEDSETAAKKISARLERERGNDDFEVLSPEQLLSQVGTILGIVQAVLVGIGAISLIVGAVGIMNSMYTSVLERTREIGIMKAVGARNSHILLIFLIESALLGLAGGVLGVLLGTGIAKLVGIVAAQAGYGLLKVGADPAIMIFGLMFALVVGTASGALPARQAALLRPVDALRK